MRHVWQMSFLKKFTQKLTSPNATVTLKLDKYGVSAGENIQGKLLVTSREEFDATEVRCEMDCTEEARVTKQVYDATLRRNVAREVTESAVLFAAKPVLVGQVHIVNGEIEEYPVNINVPAGARPTYQSITNRVNWTIKGVVAVDGRPDCVSQQVAIQVAPAPAQPVIKEREVVREVVMIPCKYCGGIMNQTETACPHCGAKRTV
jgi:hypothetical protein